MNSLFPVQCINHKHLIVFPALLHTCNHICLYTYFINGIDSFGLWCILYHIHLNQTKVHMNTAMNYKKIKYYRNIHVHTKLLVRERKKINNNFTLITDFVIDNSSSDFKQSLVYVQQWMFLQYFTILTKLTSTNVWHEL